MSGGVDVGSVNINLRLSLKQFSDDVQRGKGAANDAAHGMAREFNNSSGEAKASLALLGEEIGVHIPRHLRSVIVSIPGVGEALNAAFSSVALMALISVIVAVVQKIQEFKAKAEEAATAWDAMGESGKAAMRKLTAESIDLQAQIASLKDNFLEALRLKIKGINNESLEKITAAIDGIGKSADDVFKKLAVGGVMSFFGQGNDRAIENIKQDLDDVITKVHKLRDAGDNAGIGKLLDEKISLIKSFTAAFANEQHPEVRQAAQQREIEQLEQMRVEYVKINEVGADKKIVANLTDLKRAGRGVHDELKGLNEQYLELQKATEHLLAKQLSGQDQEKQKIDDLITRWNDYKTAWEAAHHGISALANEQLEKLTHEMAYLDEEAQASIKLMMTAAIAASKQAADIKSIGNSADKPIYSGSAEQEKLYKLQTQSNVSVAEGQKVFTATRTAAEHYKQTLAELDILLAKGDITQQTYNRAKAAASVTGAEFRQLGTFIGSTIEQATLFGRSWSDALKSIGVRIAELIIQMTLLKATSTGPKDGSSGFFSSLLGGLVSGGGHASGGEATPGHYYTVGERGPERFVPSVPGTIVPNGGGNTVNHYTVNQSISTPDADSFGKSQSHLLHQARMHLAGRGGRI